MIDVVVMVVTTTRVGRMRLLTISNVVIRINNDIPQLRKIPLVAVSDFFFVSFFFFCQSLSHWGKMTQLDCIERERETERENELRNISDDNDSDLPLFGSLTTCRNFPITPTNDYGTKITLTPKPDCNRDWYLLTWCLIAFVSSLHRNDRIQSYRSSKISDQPGTISRKALEWNNFLSL